MYPRIAAFTLAIVAHSLAAQNRIGVPDEPIIFRVAIDGPSTFTGVIPIGGASASGAPANVKFKYTGVSPMNALPPPPNFIVVTPASGVTSPVGAFSEAEVFVGLNQAVIQRMDPGRYFLVVNFSTVDESPPSRASVLVDLGLGFTSTPAITSIVNAATLQPPIAPGAIVSIYGSHLAPNRGALQYDDTASYPTTLGGTLGDGTPAGNTTITFSGIAAPLLYVSQTQINAIVPYELAGRKTADVVLTRYGRSATFTVPIQDTSPGVFTATQNGTGQGAILNAADSTFNSAANPAEKGSAITMFATGAGAWNPTVPDGALSLAATNPLCTVPNLPLCVHLVAQPVSLTIGGKPAKLLYVGTSPYQVWSLLQVNAMVPNDADSGQQPVVLTIGQNDNSQQQVTVWVQ